MSGEAVRTAFINAWDDYAPGILRLDVINAAVDGATLQAAIDGVCGAVLFTIESRRDVTFGTMPWVEERGTATVRLVGPSGMGDAQLVNIATTVARALAGRQLTPECLVQDCLGPIEEDAEGDGEAYWLAISARYVWQGREPRIQTGGH